MENKRVSGWNMLDSYSEGQAIYGRDTEIASIKESVLYNIQTFLYGKSGIGKTSLLQAGVFPELRRANYFPVVIRLAFYNNEPLNRVVKRLVEEEAESENSAINKVPLSHYVIDDTDVTNCSLYEYFAKVRFEDENHTPYIPVLVLDQFEETINNEEQWQRTVDFLRDDLYSLMDNSNIIRGASLPYTNYRVVFSMREDYLYCLEDIVDRFSLWELRYNRFRIKALDDERAEEVIRRTSGVNGLEYGKEEKIIKLIIQLVKNNSGTRFTEINTALLSLIYSLLHENSIDGCIRYNDLRKVNTYISSYYDEVCAHIGGRATRYLEQHLLTADGRRSSIDETEALASHKIKPEHFDYLVEKRLVRKIKTDSSSARYEYIHDLFAKIVHKRKKEDRKRWTELEYRSISKSLDRTMFIKKMVIISSILVAIFSIYYLLFDLLQPDLESPNPAFSSLGLFSLLTFVLTTYWIPLCTKRLHYFGLSGWNLLIVPIVLFCIFSKYFFKQSSTDLAFRLFLSLGCSIILYINLVAPIVKGSRKEKHWGYSREYEAAWNGAPINNIECIKMLSIELSCLISCYIIAEPIYFLFAEPTIGEQLTMPIVNYSLPLLSMLNIDIVLPLFVIELPFISLFSNAIHARAKSLGFAKFHALIPFWNILILFIGLFPDQLLRKLKIAKSIETNNQEDHVIIAVYDDLIAEVPKYNRNNTTSFIIGLLMLLVPFYGVIRAYNKKNSIGARVIAAQIAVVRLALDAYFGLIVCIILIFEDIALCWKILGCVGWCALLTLLIVVCRYRSNILKRGVIATIEAHPTYTQAQIGGELQINDFITERTLKKLIKKGVLSREEIDGVVCWKVNEKPKKQKE